MPSTYISHTLIYKSIPAPVSHDLKLDLHYPPSPPHPLPIVLRLHGGGLLQGNRGSIPPHMLTGMSKYGYALVSADYRLAPQTALPEILNDGLDCLRFVRTALKKLIGKPELFDTTRIAILGSSAGGYLALLAGLYVPPEISPKAVLAIYPITNPFGAFFSQSQSHPLGKVDRSIVAPFLDRSAAPESDPDASSERSKMYYYMLQEANLPELLGINRERDEERFVVAQAIRNHGREGLPPTYIVHGDADRLVGVEQSEEVAVALKHVGAVYKYDVVPGADHLFDRTEEVELKEMYAFLQRHI